MNNARCRRLVDEAIKDLNLDLTGLTVLTEAATGLFSLTASIAALAGAERVMIIAKQSRYGSVDEAIEATLALAEKWSCEQSLQSVRSRSDSCLAEADIVTNLAGVRPIDAGIISRLNSNAVIPLMFETWEFRQEDIDLAAARARQLMIMGTNENHPDVDVLSYLGPLAAKLLLQAEIEIHQAHLVVLGSGVFVEKIVRYLRLARAEVTQIEVKSDGGYSRELMREVIKESDALLVVEHQCRTALFGADAPMLEQELYDLNPGLVIAHLAGNVDREIFRAVGFHLVPDYFAPPGYMSVSTAYAGPNPLIRLHAAGLKVGEIMARARRSEPSYPEAQAKAAQHQLCQELP